MRLTEEQYELIEAYLKNELSASDRTSFETDMATDADLRTEVDRQRDLRLGLRAIGIERTLDRARTQYRATLPLPDSTRANANWQPTLVRSLSTWRYWAVAASAVLVLGVGFYAYQQTAGQRTDVAYADTMTDELTKGFPSDNLPPQVRTQFLDALTNYKAGKYDQVIERLKTVPADKQTVYYKDYFLGLSYLANQQPPEAIPLLSSALATPSAPLRQKVEWCLALAYVKNDQNEKALPILTRISTDKAHPFRALAQRVLQKIS
ncbi:hypothetical protein [Spirosoma arcticum]